MSIPHEQFCRDMKHMADRNFETYAIPTPPREINTSPVDETVAHLLRGIAFDYLGRPMTTKFWLESKFRIAYNTGVADAKAGKA